MQQDPTAAAPETTVVEPSIFDLPAWTGAEVAPPVQDNAKFAGVRFQPVGKVYHYRADGFDDLKIGDRVIVETARGKQMGQVTTLKPPRDRGLGFRRIERKANGRDLAMRHYYENKELEAMIAARAEVNDLGLPIKVARAEYAFDGGTLTFLFATHEDQAEVNVDPLGERLSHLYRARIELRQVGPREVAKIIGGMGACGIEERCCSKFLTEFSPVTIKHAKEQNISLNPNDITGMCGRLRCCLIYEYEQYVEARRHLPKLKSIIGTPQGEGKVVELLALRDSVKVRFESADERREAIFHREQLVPLEEYRRLQEKAQSGTCDRHEGGGCDCGRKEARGTERAGDERPPRPARDDRAREDRGARRDDRPRDERGRRDERARPEARMDRQPEARPEPMDLPPPETALPGTAEGDIEVFDTGLGTAPRAQDRERRGRDERPRGRGDQRRDNRGPQARGPQARGPQTQRRDERPARRDEPPAGNTPPAEGGGEQRPVRRPLPKRRQE